MKNKFLNLQKLIAVYFVVCIHCKFPGVIGDIIESLARFAVPFFFMVSGYYCLYQDKTDELVKMKNKIIRTLKLLIVANFIYVMWNGLRFYILGNSFNEIVENTLTAFSPDKWFHIIVFNDNTISTHLWFLQALLYCYIFMFIVLKYKGYLISYIISGSLLITHFICSYGFGLGGYYIRNAWFNGIPFFILGYFIHKHKMKIKAITYPYIMFALILGCMVTLIENHLVGNKLVYLGTIFIVISYFLIGLKNENRMNKNFFASLGEYCSAEIYIYHPIFIYVTFKIFDLLFLTDQAFYYWIHPLTVMIATTFMAYLLFILKKIKDEKMEK